MPFTAAEPLRAINVRFALPVVAVTKNDVAVVSLEEPVDIPGLSVDLDPYGVYAFDGYVGYSGPSAGSIAFGFTVPVSTLGGHWCTATLRSDNAGATTEDVALLRIALGNYPAGGTAGSTGVAAQPHGYVMTGAFGGPLQWRFSQGFSTASATTIAAGSWLRATRIGDV